MSRLVGLAVLLAAALAATALASLPHPPNHLVVPGVSAGGVKIGDAFGNGKKAWGGGGKCTKTTSLRICSYSSSDSSDGRASFYAQGSGPINGIQITAGSRGSNYVYDTPLKKFKTKKGIGLGSTKADVTHAYPKAKRYRVAPFSANYEYRLTGPGDHVTTFQMDAPEGGERVIAVIIRNP